jgi:hypothetical protein
MKEIAPVADAVADAVKEYGLVAPLCLETTGLASLCFKATGLASLYFKATGLASLCFDATGIGVPVIDVYQL